MNQPPAERAPSDVPTPSPETAPQDESLGTRGLRWDEIADAVWLARILGPRTPELAAEQPTPPGHRGETDSAPAEPAPPPMDPDRSPSVPLPQPAFPRLLEPPGPAAISTSPSGSPTLGPAPIQRAMPPAATMARVLRPLNQGRMSRQDMVLDECATAESAADTGLWLPRYQPAVERSFDAALVADGSSSMVVWRDTVAWFSLLLQRLGAFRDFRVRSLDTDEAEPTALGGSGPSMYSPGELCDPTGRRIVFVVTDGIGAAWRSGGATRLLARWGRTNPVVVINLLPQTMWHWGSLAPRQMNLHAPAAGLPNRLLRATSFDYPNHAMPVPMVDLSHRGLARWVRLITSPGPATENLPTLLVDPTSQDIETPEQPPDDESDMSPRERVLRFRAMASPAAFRLARLLASVPLNMAIMNVVQAAMLPGSVRSDLAQVFLGGLLTRLGEQRADSGPHAVEFDFAPGVREELLSTGRRSETVQVVRLVADHLGAAVPEMRDFRAALADPDARVDAVLSPTNAPFLTVEHAVMRALAGPYLARADRLWHAMDANPAETFTSGRTAESDMAEALPPSVPDVSVAAAYVPPPATVRTPVAGQPAMWGGVPPANINFTGRADLLSRLRAGFESHDGTNPQALYGFAGAGKTQIAVQYAHRFATEYDLVWWIPAERPALVQASFAELAKQLGLAHDEPATATAAALHELRTAAPRWRWLLVFDNADQPTDIRPFIPAGPGHVLITTRNAQWSSVARPLEVTVFSRQEGKELLSRRCPSLTDAEADAIAEALGDLPLALEQAGAWCAETGMQAQEYLRLLNDRSTELDLLDDGWPIDYETTLTGAFSMSADMLRDRAPGAWQLVQLCSFLGTEPIERSLFHRVRTVSLTPDLDEILRDPIKLSRAIRAITRYGLARIDHRENTLHIHRVIQSFIRLRMTDDEHDAMAHAAHLVLLAAMPDRPGLPRYDGTVARLLSYVRAAGAVECADPAVRGMVLGIGSNWLRRDDRQVAVDFVEDAARRWAAMLGDDHPEVGLARDLIARLRAQSSGSATRSAGRTSET